jgi:hypothetical protein
VTVTLAVLEQFPLETVTVYVVVVVGDAIGLETVVLLNPVEGDQAYPDPPLAFNCVFPPLQMETGFPAFAVSEDCTVTVTWAVSVQPFAPVTVTVYVVVAVGDAVGLAPVVALKPVAGFHAYDVPPLAVKGVLFPVQIVTLFPALAFGKALTVIVTDAVAVHPPELVTVTVYVVVTVGDAVGDAPVVALKPVAGLHAYDVPPLAFSTVLPPAQKEVFEPAFAVGNALTVM